jgi:2-dehydro-3-deoxyphosphogluconate aldolase/(4S)-4-hydroxy-2-oxoglutarate aldolase
MGAADVNLSPALPPAEARTGQGNPCRHTEPPMKKDAVLAKIKSEKVVALIRADNPDGLLDCAKAMAAGGLTSIELTMTTPGAIRMLEKATVELPDFIFGLGTVLDAETARMGILAGARFVVTPALRPEVITMCRRYSIPIFCGALTPTEALNAWEAGADAVKIFPAEFFGPAYIKSLKAPLPHIDFVPTGGVTPENVGEFLKAGATATAAGSSLVDAKSLKEKNWAAITAKAQAFVTAVAAVK